MDRSDPVAREHARKKFTELSDEIRKEILDHRVRVSDDDPGFITLHHLQKIWTKERETELGKQTRLAQFFAGLGWDDEPLLKQVEASLLKILSILIRIKWTQWSKFRETFSDHVDGSGQHNRLDANLPFKNLEQFGSQSFSTEAADSFRAHQYTFIPIDIFAGTDETFDENRRMPFVQESVKLGQGSWATVYKETVAKGQYYDLDGKPTGKEIEIVRKSFRMTSSQFWEQLEAERETLSVLRSGLFEDSRIMQSLGSITRGLDMDIFFPLAQLDLEELLYDQKSIAFIKQPVSPIDLINEMGGLAEALDYLHTGEKLRNSEGGSWICAHMDLKPANIVIVPFPHHPVGRWKITDFGLSRLKVSKDSNDPYIYVREPSLAYSLTFPKRPAGTFMAPEVENEYQKGVGPKGDIWSLGCIMSLVLCYAVGGAKLVKAFEDERKMRRKGDGSVSRYGEARFYCDEGLKVKDEVETWLKKLVKQNNALWIKDSVTIILAMLKIDPKDRPKAKHVETHLFRHIVPNIKSGMTTIHGDSTLEQPGHRPRDAPKPREVAEPPVMRDDGANTFIGPDSVLSPPQLVRYPDHAIAKVHSTFVKIAFRERKRIVQAAFSSSDGWVAFLSERKVFLLPVLMLGERKLWTPKVSEVKVGFDDGDGLCLSSPVDCVWKSMALAGNYLLVQKENSRLHEYAISLYDTSSSDRITEIKMLSCPRDLLGATVSSQGDVVMRLDSYLELFVARDNWSPRRLHTRSHTKWAVFSSDGNWLFSWSKDRGLMHSFFWHTHHETIHGNLQASSSNLNDEILPFSTLPAYATWDSNPGRVTIFQAPADQLVKTVFEELFVGIKGGIVTPASNAIVLVRITTGFARDTSQLFLIPFCQGDDGLVRPRSDNAPKAHKLGYNLCQRESECGLAIQMNESTGLLENVLLVHCTGVIEKIECKSE